MTCDQSRALMRTFRTLSRGERAGLFVHLRECYACFKDAESLDGLTTADECEAVERTIDEDLEDDEFVEAIQ